MKVTSAWARPIQGVSQQPAKVRKDGQVEMQENMIPSAVDGLTSRMGTEQVKVFGETFPPGTVYHHYSRGDGEEYFILIEPSSSVPRVFDEEGNEITVTDTAGDSYCSTATPLDDLVLKTIADTTVVVRNDVPCYMDSTSVTTLDPSQALIYVQSGAYGRTYEVEVDGVSVAAYTVPDGSSSAHSPKATTDYIASQLMATSWVSATSNGNLVAGPLTSVVGAGETYYLLAVGQEHQITLIGGSIVTPLRIEVIAGQPVIVFNGTSYPGGTAYTEYHRSIGAGGLSSLAGYTATLQGSVIHLAKDDGSSFEIGSIDGNNGNSLITLKEETSSLADLPAYGPEVAEGFVIKLQGTGEDDESGFYLKLLEIKGDRAKWVETTGDAIYTAYKEEVLPHTLTDDTTVSGNFIWDVAPWVDRDVGDNDSNPMPSFINPDDPTSATLGPTINAVGLFQNRLFFVVGETVILSRSGEFFNFYRKSAKVATDDDPIEVYSDSAQTSNIERYSILDGDVVFFSSEGQLVLPGDRPITKANATLRLSNSFKTQLKMNPVASGESVFFAFNYGGYTGVREFFTDSDTDTRRGFPITEHVDRYIIGEPRHATINQNNQWLVMLTEDDMNVMYVYNWLWIADEKVQSAWHKWYIPDGERIEYVKFSKDNLWALITRADGTYLEKLNVGDIIDSGLGTAVHLDRRVYPVATLSAGYWTFTDPYPNESEAALQDEFQFVRSTGAYPEEIGVPIEIERDGENLFTREDLASSGSVSIIAGRKYPKRFTPTAPVIRDAKDRVIGLDLFILSRVYLNYERIGNVGVTVTDRYGHTYTYNTIDRRIGDPRNVAGFVEQRAGVFDFPVRTRADEVTITFSTDDYLPFQVRDMEWTGKFNQRGRRI